MIGHHDSIPDSVPDSRPDPSLDPQPASPPQVAKGDTSDQTPQAAAEAGVAVEVGGRDGPDPTRYGDWEKNGRCIDF